MQSLPARPGELEGAQAPLGDALVAIVGAARAAWPGVELDEARFVSFVGARMPLTEGDRLRTEVVLAALARLRTPDLWLACACGDGDPTALAAFERAYGNDIDIALAALGAPGHVADEARQIVRTRLFVAVPGSEPVIARYGGRGDLRAWVRATTVRAAIDLIRQGKRELPSDDELLDAPITPADPELARLRERYGAEFKEAFGEAFAALPKRDRVLLRYRYVDGLDVDGIGAVYRVHRSTAARWLQRIRQELLDDTRARLAARLGVASTELDSILRFIGSELDVSISSALRG
ncbi:MAG TPA: sigma-70 family RNA polymerase sigma factor [Kofleriaceae bacterium]|nr:sigma-70 family RNA polymerase sigma factor [Kofleriaceae bacterium]